MTPCWGFEHREEAERFLEQLRERLGKFGLELHPEKTRLIEFGRYAAERRKKRGEGKPETFNFLGFTHICGTNHQTGHFTVRRKTIGKRMAAKLKDIRAQLHRRMHAGLPANRASGCGRWCGGISSITRFRATGSDCRRFRREVLCHWYQALRRRSQRSRLTCGVPFRERLRCLAATRPNSATLPEPCALTPTTPIRGKNRVR